MNRSSPTTSTPTPTSGPGPGGSALYYAPSEVRRAMSEAWGDRADKDPTRFDAWVERRLGALRGEGLLITEQQATDAHAQRDLRVGDAAIYVGPTREEENGYKRPTRQDGYISAVTPQGTITFEPLDETAPGLLVQKGTVSYWLLERAPARAAPSIYAVTRPREALR